MKPSFVSMSVCDPQIITAVKQSTHSLISEFLQPYKARPETSASAARRLVSGALGLHAQIPREKRELERKQLKEAKGRDLELRLLSLSKSVMCSWKP